MRNLSLILIVWTLLSCNEKQKTTPEEVKTEVVAKVTENKYPEAFIRVLNAHGGLANWKRQKTLSFEIPSENGVELQTIDLYSRKDKIVKGAVAMGFDGKNVWLLDEAKTYKGDPAFYHNLMFYFSAMPFVLADKGIVYGATEALVFEGKSYPGISISYHPGVGVSYKDEYVMHYDPETYQMAWLGYTVSYGTGEKSDHMNWIRYADWGSVDGLLLPQSITWYDHEGKALKEPKNTVNFGAINVSTEAHQDKYYLQPELATVVTGKVQ